MLQKIERLSFSATSCVLPTTGSFPPYTGQLLHVALCIGPCSTFLVSMKVDFWNIHSVVFHEEMVPFFCLDVSSQEFPACGEHGWFQEYYKL